MIPTRNRVVISGIGVLAPGSVDRDSFWTNALAGAAAVGPIPDHWRLYYPAPVSRIWAPLPPIDWLRYPISQIECLQLDMTARLAIAASWQALVHARLEPVLRNEKRNSFTVKGVDQSRAGVCIGTGIGGICSFASNEAHQLYAPFGEKIRQAGISPAEIPFVRYPARFSPFAVPMSMPNGASAALGIKYSFSGLNRTIAGACAAGTMAIGNAFHAILSGELDIALAGGVDYLADDYGGIFRAFDTARTLVSSRDDPQSANRPFDRRHSGFLFAEGGCAILVIESLAHALDREAQPIAEITAFAETFDAYSAMAIDPSGRRIEALIGMLLERAGVSPSSVNYINTHGTGTVANDEIEAGVIGRIFGKTVAVNATKSIIGHTIGAAGAIEAAVTALSIFHGKTHGCVNLRDAIADLDFITTPRSMEIGHAISQSFAFGGHNAAVVLSRV